MNESSTRMNEEDDDKNSLLCDLIKIEKISFYCSSAMRRQESK
jgi:hypothetical protein